MNNNNNNNKKRNNFKNNRNRYKKNAQDEAPSFLDALDLSIPEDRKIVMGITGEPGCGKSALSRELHRLGAYVIDADRAGHEIIETPLVKKKIVEAFGEDILGAEDGLINREILASKVFENEETVKALNAIVHPKLKMKIKQDLKKAGKFIVIDAALLFTLGFSDLCEETVYVNSTRELRLERVENRGWDEEELKKRETALGDSEERQKECSMVVENSSEQSHLKIFAKTILTKILGLEIKVEEKKVEIERVLNSEFATNMILPDKEPVSLMLEEYLNKPVPDLQEEGEECGVKDVRHLSRPELICDIFRKKANGKNDHIVVEGYIEHYKEYTGFLRHSKNGYTTSQTDTYINAHQIKKCGIKNGMHIKGVARAPRTNEKCPQMLTITHVMGYPVEELPRFTAFNDLVPLHAEERIFLERTDKPDDYNLRIIDLVAPIGKGQRGLIVAQPKCGKTVYLQKMANAIALNNPECEVFVLLIDERPEEVTDMQRNVKAEVIASTFDQYSSRHVQIAEMTINKSKRLVEQGKDVVILLDSITRLARAYNAEAPSSGKVMSGGVESGALIKPKQFFGAARNIENGGSLTIIATALVDTGSLMDTVIFEEFKGTGNMELVLDRRLANKGIYPALDTAQSGTRRDELLVNNPDEMERLRAIRRFLADRSPQDGVEFLKNQLSSTKTNVEYLMNIDLKNNNGWR